MNALISMEEEFISAGEDQNTEKIFAQMHKRIQPQLMQFKKTNFWELDRAKYSISALVSIYRTLFLIEWLMC